PSGGSDLHVVYGPNEAGKSSLLRAIGDLLFEIPVRSTDDFVHEYKRMKICADLRSRDGRTLSIQRRKRAKETLLGADEAPLPDDTLIKWLGHADRRYFTTMFGLASAELRKGAEELLRGEGDLGKALFSASLGGTPVHKIQEALEESAKLLFANRARASIRTNAGAHAEAMKLSKDCLIKAEDWETLEREVAEATQRQAVIDERKLELQKQIDWIQRCLDTLPTLGKLRAKKQAIAELPPAPLVPAHFVNEARAALLAKRQLETELRRCCEEIARLGVLWKACQPREDLLEHEVEIESRHQAFSLYYEQCARLTKAEAELAAQEPGLRAAMRDLAIAGELEILETLRLTAADMARVRELATAVTTSGQRLEAHAQTLRDKEAAISQLQSKLDRLVAKEVTSVREAVIQSAAAAEAQRKLPDAQADTAKAEREMRSQQAFLVGAPPETVDAYALRLPAKSSTTLLQTEQEELLRSKKALENELAETNKQLAKWKRELAQLERRGALPSVKDLTQAREQRETVWRKIVGVWTSGDAEGRESLAILHEQSQKHADVLADELREHADQVAKADQVRDHIAEGEEDIVATTECLRLLDQSLSQWQERWNDLWQPAGIAARSPEEMSEWRDQWLEFRRRFERWQLLNDGLVGSQALITRAEQCLREALRDGQGRAFDVLFEEARRMVVKADNDQGARTAFEQELAQATQERDQLSKLGEGLAAAAKAAIEGWKLLARELHLNAEISPAAGLDLVGRRRELIQRFDAWKDLQSQAQQLHNDTVKYVQSVASLATTLGFSKANADVLDGQLWRSLSEAREARNTQRKLAVDMEAARSKEHALLSEAEALTTKLEGVLRLVALQDLE
ncbi:MAG: hypothetical protein JWO08_4709, partial [Verrucomicrobiaceae bacterium]|nr:hypothetical protein [Verrucomicrobiaceae bacterium]